MKQTVNAMMQLIRGEICGETLPEDFGRALTDEQRKRLYALSKKHDLAHLVGVALDNRALLGEGEAAEHFRRQSVMAVYRYQQLQYAYEQVCGLFEEQEIPFLPLKGSVLRRFYPQPWMRTSCDIDILVQVADLERAKAALTSRLGYRFEAENSYDWAFFSPTGVHLELHHSLLEDGDEKIYRNSLTRIWELVTPKSNGMEQEMSDALFYTYHVYHMVKHYVLGGCGVRPFLDLWILNHKVQFDLAERKRLLDAEGLTAFAAGAEALSEAWFGGAEHTDLTLEMELFLLKAGVYGNLENKVAVQQVKRGSKWKYMISRIWMPYNVLKIHYPILKKHKWMLFFCQVARWLRLLFRGGVKRGIGELSMNQSVSGEQQAKTEAMLEKLGLR
ncbi:MAG: hypothetical protein E7620_05660 [Ruminococcaceae bacterium]|nr:hypothetical protein [Oscillospiraceae bacterium]